MSAAIILSNFIFSIGGFILGFVVARIGQRVEEVSEVIVDGDKPVALKPRKTRFSWRQALGVVVLLLAIGSTITSAVASRDQRVSAEQMRRIAECQAEFNRAYRLAIAERSEAANAERQSMRAMLEVILNPGATPEVRREAVTKYYQSLDRADQTRAQNPLPSTDRCG